MRAPRTVAHGKFDHDLGAALSECHGGVGKKPPPPTRYHMLFSVRPTSLTHLSSLSHCPHSPTLPHPLSLTHCPSPTVTHCPRSLTADPGPTGREWRRGRAFGPDRFLPLGPRQGQQRRHGPYSDSPHEDRVLLTMDWRPHARVYIHMKDLCLPRVHESLGRGMCR